MLADEANMQKQKKREEQLKRWKEREGNDEISRKNGEKIEDFQQPPFKKTKVRFPKGCVFLAACSSGDTEEVKQHLKLGVNINTTNIDGLTALHQACIDANLDMVKFLVEYNADINSQDNEGWTPIHAAVSVGNLEVCK
jgi:ankyrin repeat protein